MSASVQLLTAIKECNDRGLYQSSKWAAELLSSMEDSNDILEATKPNSMTIKECKLYTLAFTYFQCREYSRVVHILRGQNHPLLLFLRFYSQYLNGEHAILSEQIERNPELPSIHRELEPLYAHGKADGFLCYLLAIVCGKLDLKEEAFKAAVDSVIQYPYNWSAWIELSSYIQTDALTAETETNSRDYRAWYCLGNVYEIMRMYYYSTYYFEKAVSLRPNDARGWHALGVSYDYLNREEEAVICLKRAIDCTEGEPVEMQLFTRLARISVKTNDAAAAFGHYDRVFHCPEFAESDDEGLVSEVSSYLARYQLKMGNYAKAEYYLQYIADSSEGKLLQREITSFTKRKQ
ncbi:anaphase-promoting complex component apc8 [Phlyctochytrium planicorne]|nr:anaphase-promoting complex component apc8 [Phlyctochytrium planicorne]